MMTPSEVNTLLWQRGLPEIGEWLQRELQALDRYQRECLQLREQLKTLEKMLPQDVHDERERDREEVLESWRPKYTRRAGSESDG